MGYCRVSFGFESIVETGGFFIHVIRKEWVLHSKYSNNHRLQCVPVQEARDKRKNSTVNAAGPMGNLLKRDFHLLFPLLILKLIFYGSCIPLKIMFHIYSSEESRQSASFIRKVVWCHFAVLLNAAANPLVYAVKLPIFQRWIEKRKKGRSRDVRKDRYHAAAAGGGGGGGGAAAAAAVIMQ